MTEPRLINVALDYARARHRYKQAAARWREDTSLANERDRDLAYAEMEAAADILEAAGLAWDAQHEGDAA